MIRSAQHRLARVVRSSAFRAVSTFLLATGALAGTGGLVIAQHHQEHDKTELQGEVQAARKETSQVKAQLDDVKGEQECRAQLSANASVLSGQVLSGIASLLVALNAKDLDAEAQSIELFRVTAPALSLALQRQKNAVATCKGATSTPPAVTTTPTTTSTTAPPTSTTARPKRTTTTTRPTTSTGQPSTTATTFPSSPTTALTPCTGITLPGGGPCL